MPSGLDLYKLFLIFVRTLAVFIAAPIFGSRTIPVMVKIGLAALLSLLILPTLSAAAPLPLPGAEATLASWPTDWLVLFLTIGQEVLVGVIIGFVSNLVFLTVGMAASIMGVQVGFRAANIFDPMTSASTSALEQFYTLLAFALFLAINGHHWLLLGLSRSFEVTPLGTFVFQPLTVERLVFLTSETFVAAVRISLPVMGALLLADLGMGIVARAVPQIHVFFLGLPIKEAFGIAAIGLALVMTMPLIKKLMGNIVADVLVVVHP
jgi:flagellar biosynthetic protein FliR